MGECGGCFPTRAAGLFPHRLPREPEDEPEPILQQRLLGELLVVALGGALVGHGVFDLVHRFFIDNPGVPQWWPGFCLAFDALLGGFLAVQLIKHPERVHFEGR